MNTQFIELTETDDEIIFINPFQILWFRPDEKGSMIALNIRGRNDQPYIVYVNENFETIKTKLENRE